MAMFNYNQYTSTASTETKQEKTTDYKVGYFSLKKDGDTAIVRFNYSSVDQFKFATVHSVRDGNHWVKVSCLSDRDHPEIKCPFCEKAKTQDDFKVQSRFYVQLLDYQTQQDGTVKPVAKVWDRPAKFATDLKGKLDLYHDLTDCLFIVTRHGAAGDQSTYYSLDLAPSQFYKDEIYIKDFSAFADHDISKHSFWVKTADEMNTFLATGEFPKRQKAADEPSRNLETLIPTEAESKSIEAALNIPEHPATAGDDNPFFNSADVPVMPQAAPAPTPAPAAPRASRYGNY